MTLVLDKPRLSEIAPRARRLLFPPADPYLARPDAWVRDRLGEHLWSKQQEIARSVVEHRQTVVPSCHASGKSYLAARLAAWWIDTHPPGEAFVVTSAPSQQQVRTILWREISRAHRVGRLKGQISAGQVPEWKIAGEVVAFGRKTADASSPEEAMAAFQGIHAKYMLVVLDEAAGVPEWLYDAAMTLATGAHDRILAIGNPHDPQSHFAKVCSPGTTWNVIPISAYDTPRFTGEPIAHDIPLVTPEWVDNVRAEWGEESPLFQARVHARFPDVSDDVLFPPWLIERAWANDLSAEELDAPSCYGVDVARYGDDATAVYRSRGGVIRLVKVARQMDTEDVADLVEGVLRTHGANRPPAVVDAVGLGAGVADKLKRRGHKVVEFNAGASAFDRARYANRRAEIFYELQRAMADFRVDLDPADTGLAAELASIRWRIRGPQVAIESKDDARKRGVHSPDRADAAAQAFAGAKPGYQLPARDLRPEAQTITGDLLTLEM